MKSKKLVSISPTLVSHNSDSDLWECSCSFANESRIVSDERNSQAFVGVSVIGFSSPQYPEARVSLLNFNTFISSLVP